MLSLVRWLFDASVHAHLLRSCALALALFAPVVAPASPSGPTTVDAAHIQLPGSRLLGQATLTYFGLRIYHARLWTLPGFNPHKTGDQPLVLELEYFRSIPGKSIAERSLQEMRRAGELSPELGQRWLADMQRLFPNVKPGDRITGQHVPAQGARFWHNGSPIGQVDDELFSQRFFGIWLAPSTSEADLRLQLLGLDRTAPRGFASTP